MFLVYFTVQIDYQFYATQKQPNLFPIYYHDNESVQVVNKATFLEVSDGKLLIPIATNIPIEFCPASPLIPKTPTMEHLPLNGTKYFRHQTDLLRQELEKNVIAINDFKNFINKTLAKERAHKNDAAEILHERIRMLEKENQYLNN